MLTPDFVPARRGDLILVKRNSRIYYNDHRPTDVTERYRFGLVSSVTREGLTKTFVPAGGNATERIGDGGYVAAHGRCWVIPKTEIDVAGVINATVNLVFNSMAQAREFARPFRLKDQ